MLPATNAVHQGRLIEHHTYAHATQRTCLPRRLRQSMLGSGWLRPVAETHQRHTVHPGIARASKQPMVDEAAGPARHSTKPVAPVPSDEKELVQMLILLSGLAGRMDDVTVPSVAAKTGLSLVTTSATCDRALSSPLSSMSDEFGDGMALPLSDVRRAAEQLAASVGGTQAMQSAWSPPQQSSALRPAALAGRGDSSFSPSEGRRSTLDALFAASDHRSLQASSSGGGGADSDPSVLVLRALRLQRQLGKAAARAVAAGKPLATSLGSVTSKAASATMAAVIKNVNMNAGHGASPQAAAAYAAAAAFGEDAGSGSSTPSRSGASSNGSSVAGGGAAAAFSRVASVAAATGVALASPFFQATPASDWLIADDASARVRYVAIAAPDALSRIAKQAASDLVTFESYSLGVKINRKLYDEAQALYQRFIPLVLDYLEDVPGGQVCLVGQGLGGSLATVLALMAVHRGLSHGSLAPVHAFNAPAVLVEVPDAQLWCSKDGCSTEDIGYMVDDLMRRGVLSELGLRQDAVRNVYYTAAAAQAAGAGSSGGSGGIGKLVSGLGSWDVGALQQSSLVPDVLKAWLRGSGGGAAAKASGSRPVTILNPVGRLMLFTPDATSNGVHH